MSMLVVKVRRRVGLHELRDTSFRTMDNVNFWLWHIENKAKVEEEERTSRKYEKRVWICWDLVLIFEYMRTKGFTKIRENGVNMLRLKKNKGLHENLGRWYEYVEVEEEERASRKSEKRVPAWGWTLEGEGSVKFYFCERRKKRWWRGIVYESQNLWR